MQASKQKPASNKHKKKGAKNATISDKNRAQNKANYTNENVLPICAYPIDQVSFEVSQSPANLLLGHSARETSVAIKRTIKYFDHKKNFEYKFSDELDAEFPERLPTEVFQIDQMNTSMFSEQELLKQQRKDIQKFFHRRYFLFSKFDRGIEIDKEGWYSVTPEPIAEYLAHRVAMQFNPCYRKVDDGGAQFHHDQDGDAEMKDEDEAHRTVNVLDAFGGVGGNLIQFALHGGFCCGVDTDLDKIEIMRNNAQVYGLSEDKHYQLLNQDFLKLPAVSADDEFFAIPKSGGLGFDAVFLSPPWGGSYYFMLEEYKLEHVFPDFDSIIEKATQYSENLMLFLPRNTSISDLVARLSKFSHKLVGDRRRSQIEDFLGKHADQASQQQAAGQELAIEIEQLTVGDSCKALLVYTGDLAAIEPREVAQSFMESQCHLQPNQQAAFKPQSQSIRQYRTQTTRSRGGSSASSVKSGHSGRSRGSSSGASSFNQQTEYLRAILTNVFTACGYWHFNKYLQRTGKSKLSLQGVVKQLQKKFSNEEWYYLRKIHKKEHNFFLNKNGKRGESGGGWMDFSCKTSRSGLSTFSQKTLSIASNNDSNEVEESKGQIGTQQHSKPKLISSSGRKRALSSSTLSVDSAKHADLSAFTHDMKMIDEEESDNSAHSLMEEANRRLAAPEIIAQANEESDDEDKPESEVEEQVDEAEAFGEDDDFFGWTKVKNRKLRKIERTVELKDLKERDFHELIEAKNQDKRFFGWLHFQPLFHEFDVDVMKHGNPLEEGDIQNQDLNRPKRGKTTADYTLENDFLFGEFFDAKMEGELDGD